MHGERPGGALAVVATDGKGRLVIGASTQRQMVKYLSPQDQLDMIEIAKEDKKKALAVWRSFKPELGIE